MSKMFRPWSVNDAWLLPPSVQEFVPAGHSAHLVRDLVSEELDLTAILSTYTELRGCPPYHPAMMVALLLHAYSRTSTPRVGSHAVARSALISRRSRP